MECPNIDGLGLSSVSRATWAILFLGLAVLGPFHAKATVPNDAEVAQRAFNQAISSYAARAESCRSDRVIRKYDIGLRYGEAELRDILAYFSARRYYECVMKDMGEALAAGLWLAGNSEKATASKTLASLELVWAPYADYVRSQARFRKLPEKARQSAESDPAFQEPFDLIESARALGL